MRGEEALVTLEKSHAAHAYLSSKIYRTPLASAQRIGQMTKPHVRRLKAERQQKTGSFNLRGAAIKNGRRMTRCGASPLRSRPIALLLGALTLTVTLAGCGETLSAPFATPTAPAPTATSTNPGTPAPKIAARAAYLMNAQTGEIYLSVNAETPVALASTTKIMTALAAIQFFLSVDLPVKIGADAVAMNTNGNSVAKLRLGDRLTLREALYAPMLPSGDDAAVAIADAVAGSQEKFTGLMNSEAASLGLRHTSYLNVSGLDPDDGSDCARKYGNCSSAHDLVILAKYAMANPEFRAIVSTVVFTLPATDRHGRYMWTTTNNLLTSRRYDGIEGVKTGHTENAGYCLVFEAAHMDKRLVGVVLGEQTDDGRFADAAALLDWGFGAQKAP
jgi:D-alanyl-D-alanine carboxypeptidase (penicillin-binding protein 5/6)